MQDFADTHYGAHNLDAFEFAHALRGYPPAPRKCETRQELALWFLKFGTAAGACLAKAET